MRSISSSATGNHKLLSQQTVPAGSHATTPRMEASLGNSFLQLPWEQLLSHLCPASLGQLACTCKQLCAVVDDANPSIWQHAAIQILGPEHPVVAPCGTAGCLTVRSVRAALQRHGEAIHNMRRGQYYGVKVPWASKPQISPTGRQYAVCFNIPTISLGIRVYNAASGRQTTFIDTLQGSGRFCLDHLRWSCNGEELRFTLSNLGYHEVHRAYVSKQHSTLQHTFQSPQNIVLDLSPYGQYIEVMAHTVSGMKLWILDFENAHKVLELPLTTGSSESWHVHDGAIAYTHWVGAVDRTWDVHAVCLRTKSPLFTCSGPLGHLDLVAFAPCHARVGFLKQKHGQQQAIVGMGTKDGGHMQLEVMYNSEMELDNISAAPNNQFVAFQESEADTGRACGVIVSADTKAVCYRTAMFHLLACEVNWKAAWSSDSKWVILYVSTASNSLHSPRVLVNVVTWHESQIFSTTKLASICSLVWDRDVCSVLAHTCDTSRSVLGVQCADSVWLLSFVRLSQTTTPLFSYNQWYKCVISLCEVVHWQRLLSACLMLLPCFCEWVPLIVIYVWVSLWHHL